MKINERSQFAGYRLALLVLLLPVYSSASLLQPVLERYSTEAIEENPAFIGFSAESGRWLFENRHATGKPDTPSCISCHDSNPVLSGQTRAGKAIEPMAISKSPDRYSDNAKIEKWFGRNCRSVLGRTCTAEEKGNFLTYMLSQ